MFKISVHSDTDAHTIKLEGKIMGVWVDELNAVWRSLGPELHATQLCLDVRGVSFVDARGKLLLREMHQAANASFLADSPLTRRFAQDAMQRVSETAKE
jgi:ABC-type transporter Mla MlaB component